MIYKVTFIQTHEYEVKIDTDEDSDYDYEAEAIEKAEKEFRNDMSRPVAHTSYGQ